MQALILVPPRGVCKPRPLNIPTVQCSLPTTAHQSSPPRRVTAREPILPVRYGTLFDYGEVNCFENLEIVQVTRILLLLWMDSLF